MGGDGGGVGESGKQKETVGGHSGRTNLNAGKGTVHMSDKPQLAVSKERVYKGCMHHTHSKLHTALSCLESIQSGLKEGKQYRTLRVSTLYRELM